MQQRPRRTGAGRLLLARAGPRRAGLALVGLAVAVAALLAVVVVGLSLRGQASAVRATIADTPGDASVVLSTAPRTDRAAQDAAVRGVVARTLGAVPVRVVAATTAGPFTARGSRSSGAVLLVADDGTVRDAVALTSGARGATIDEAGARLLGVAPGADLVVSGTGTRLVVHVTGIWRERDAGAAVWAGLGRGAQGSAARLLVPASVVEASGDASAQWSVTPGAVTPAQLGDLQRGMAGLLDAANADGAVTSTTVTATGAGAETAGTMLNAVAGAEALLPGAVGALAIASVLALLLLAGVVADARETETRLLLERGASRGTVLGLAAAEGSAVVVAGTAVGTGAGLLLLAPAGPPTGWPELVLPPAAVVIGALAVLVVVAARAVGDAHGRTPPRRRVPAVVPAALLVAAAAVATWRFLTAETPGAPPDPIGVLAPALLLGSAAVLALLGLPVVGRIADARSARSAAFVAPLAARRLARGLAAQGATVAAVVLAVGAVAVSAGLLGTWTTFAARGAAVANGADVRADYGIDDFTGGPAALLPVASARRLSGVRAAVPARVTDGRVLSGTLEVVAAPAAWLTAASGGGVPARTGAQQGVPLPTGTRALRIAVTAGTIPVVITVWLQDADGDLASIVLRGAPPGTTDVPISVPAGSWHVVALDLRAGTTIAGHATAAALTAVVTATGAVPVRGSWIISDPASLGEGLAMRGVVGAALDPPQPVPDGSGRYEQPGVRLVPSIPIAPVAISEAAAAALSVEVGSQLEVQEDRGEFRAVVREIVPVVPGTDGGPAIAGDLAGIEQAELGRGQAVPAVNEIWLDAGRRDPVAAALRVSAGAPTVTTADAVLTHRFVDGTADGLRLASAGAALFAIVVAAAGAQVVAERRRGETAVLRALGARAGQQVAARTAEAGGVLAGGSAVGLAAGALVTLLTAAPLARLADGTAPANLVPVGGTETPLLVLGLAALAAAWVAVLAVTAVRLARSARA